jgi:hypothetical protein
MKTEGLKAMIDLALKSGQEDKIPATAAEKLGFGGEVSRKRAVYGKGEAPDKRERAFSVVPAKNPNALILSVWDDAGVHLSLFKTTLDGTLQLAIRTKGNPSDKANPAVVLDPAAKATRDEFETELEFYGTHARKLEPNHPPRDEAPMPKNPPKPKPNADPKPEAPHGFVTAPKPGSKPDAPPEPKTGKKKP